MTSYQDLIGPEALVAIENLFENNRDLALSFVSIEDVTNQILAFVRLNSASLEKEESVYSAYQTALASLLHSGKVALRSFGLSSAGQKQRDDLLRHIGALPEEAPPPDPYADVISDFHNLETSALSQKIGLDKDYASRYRAAAMSGRLT